jgi:hypothetical protein
MNDKEKKDKNISDVFKKVISTGVSAAFMTEEALKKVAQDLPISKDMVKGLVENAKNTKDEVITSVKSEVSNYLSKIDLGKEVEKVLDKYDLEVSARVGFRKKEKNSKKEEK